MCVSILFTAWCPIEHGSGSTLSADFCFSSNLPDSYLLHLALFVESWTINEASSNAGGLLRWPVKLLLPVGFFLMALQGISEIIKRVAALEHVIDVDFKYEKPLQ
jgi:TRAP-type mannitol/chloroaromatic compound transport system permease small subunit